MTDELELLARNAFLTGAYFKNYAGGTATGGADSLADISQKDLFDYQWAAKAQLRAMTLGLPGFEDGAGPMVAITTPATIYSFMTNSDWIGLNKYTDKGLSRVFTGEVGTLYGTKYIVSPINILWNAGRITAQTTIAAAASAGDGGADWGPYTVGQSGATKYIQLADATDINIGDVVTIHNTRTSAYGVTNGVDPYAGYQFHRIVRSKSGNNIGFDRPLFWDFKADLGLGVYGYVTKALHIHSTIFVSGEGGVVCGVTQPPTLHIPPVMDDLEAMRRFSWDAYLKYQAFRVERYEVFFHAGEVAVQRGIQMGGEYN